MDLQELKKAILKKKKSSVTEKTFHKIINNSFRKYKGFSEKVPDMGGTPADLRFTPKKSYDGNSVFRGQCWFWEAKFSRGISALNINSLTEKQRDSLLTIKANKYDQLIFPVVIYGCYEPRQWKILFFIDIEYLVKKISIYKNEFVEWMEKGYYLETVRNGDKEIFNPELIRVIGL